MSTENARVDALQPTRTAEVRISVFVYPASIFVRQLLTFIAPPILSLHNAASEPTPHTGRVLVHWCDDSAHYPAIIDDYNNGRYHLIYDDGHEEWIDLPSEEVIFMPLGWHESVGESGV